MNLQQMKQLVALAETLNFRRAAERLHMAQPPLSVSIRRLEDELGARLFARERRGIRLTPAGEAVLAHARQIAFHAEQLKRAAASASGGMSGRLRIAFVGSAAYSLFPRVLPVFRERFPGVELDLRESTTTQMLQQVERGDVDLALVRYPVVEATTVVLRPVESDVLAAALPAGSPLARKRTLRMRDLADEPFVTYSATAAMNLRVQVVAACQAAGFTPRIVQEAVQVQTVLSLVGSGLGVALVPSLSRMQAPAGVEFRRLTDGGERLETALAVATHAHNEPAVAARFRDVLAEVESQGARRQRKRVAQPA
ncbi:MULTISPECIES: LysR family transcriptional regulator [Ramlibacter]|uniref:LysR family transcriptional regulator n=1 Tax=Ramlibacter pinisoli TaxID=2682844 RepID=A0A6N8J058_9BURK|nr:MULTISPECIES: LysR family transcriptional regulator [Ramlibacter]MBA2962293.1 LysR family transcriptional regulator [Ramlibacter sp. CGMCC 1.13660]MVQ32235.1 LysR family transcriptional regulator [Ramlibacter pinisoli]